jgi:AraC family transcriptional regulator
MVTCALESGSVAHRAPGASLRHRSIMQIEVPLGSAELIEYDVSGPYRDHEFPGDHVVEMLLAEPSSPREGRILPLVRTLPIGEILFKPADHWIEIDWPAKTCVRAIRCSFRKELVHPPRVWLAEELAAALNIRSGPIRRAMHSLAEELLSPGFNSHLLTESLSVVVGVELGRYLRQRGCHSPAGRLTNDQLALVNNRIEVQGYVPTAAELASDCRMSRRHFFRLFRQTTGMSLSDYATHRRVDRAKALLGHKGLAVKQVAYQCGFQTQSGFSAAFRRATGMTPREYQMGGRDNGRSSA